MGLVPFRGFEIHDSASRVRDVMPAWKPGKLEKQCDYVKSLENFLKKELDGPAVYSEKNLGDFVADLVIAEEVVIKIQQGLTTAVQLKTIQDYIKNFKYWKGVMLIILVDSVDDAYLEKLDDEINQINNDLEFTSNQAIVVMRR